MVTRGGLNPDIIHKGCDEGREGLLVVQFACQENGCRLPFLVLLRVSMSVREAAEHAVCASSSIYPSNLQKYADHDGARNKCLAS